MAPDSGAVQRWAASHAATITPAAADAAREPAGTAVREFPQEPVPAVVAAFTEIRTWDGAAEYINRVAWAPDPDGQLLLATAGTDGIARIWDASTGRALHTLTGHTDVIAGAEWGRMRNGQLLLATGSYDGTARIWDPGTGRCLHTLISRSEGSAPSGSVVVAWGADPGASLVLATGDVNGTIQIWDPGTGRELHAFPGQQPGNNPGAAGIFSMDWEAGADGQARLATGAFGTWMLRVWDPHTGQALYSSANLTGAIYSIAYGHRAAGQLVLAIAADEATVWTEENDEFTFQTLPPVSGTTYAARWAPITDGRLLLATATDGAVHLWDGHALNRLHTEEVDLAETGPERLDWILAPDGHLLLAVASNGGQVHVWEAVLDPPARPRATQSRESPVSGRAVQRQPGPARLVLPPEEVTPPFPEAAQTREATAILACVTTPDGQTLLATTSDEPNDTQLWDLESGRHLRTLTGHSGGVRDVAWAQTADGRLLLATGSQDGTARIWNPATGQELHTLTGHGETVYAVAWGTRPDGTLLLATGSQDGTARIWNPATGQQLGGLTGHGGAVYAVAWGTRPDGTLLLATGSNGGSTRIWDPATGQQLGALNVRTENQNIVTVEWATQPDGTLLLATGGPGGSTRIWDPDTGQELHILTGPGQEGDSVFAAAWARAADGRLLLATAGNAENAGNADTADTARIWDPGTGTELASLPGTGSDWRSAAWTRDQDGNLLLLLANRDPAAGPVRAWLVENGTGSQTEPQEPGRPGTLRATRTSRQLLRLGTGGLWLSLGLLTDLITLTGSEETPPTAGLHEVRLATLADEPGISRLRDLAAGQPSWSPDARAAFAALLTAGLDIPAQYAPPDDADPATLAAALTAALADAPGSLAASWRVPVAELRAATAQITAQTITLLKILGPDACTADPLLPLRLAHHVPRLPALSLRELRFLASGGSRQPPSAHAALGTFTYSPGTVGLARSGPLTRLLPTQLALPPDLLTTRLAENQLLYRQHRAPAPPAPQPVTLVLDTTPPTYGPAGTALRLAAHLITTTLWDHGHHPTLITLDNPATPIELRTPADLIRLWTSTTLDNPAAHLPAARHTATTLGQPAVLLTHHQTARDNRYTPGPANRLLTTHQPPEKPPPEPASPWHAHLPPNPAEAQLTTAIRRLLTPSAEDGRAS